MADSKKVGEGYFLVKGTARELADGRVYVVTENGYLEEMTEACMCMDCKHFLNEIGYCFYRNPLMFTVAADSFCAWGEPKPTVEDQSKRWADPR